MKAAVIESVGKLVVRDLDAPAVGDYDALCETQYGALCTGTDTHLLHGHAPFCYWVRLPAILGHESVGKVVKTGAKVRNLKPGDLVTRVGHPGANGVGKAWGGFAELSLAKDWRAMRDDGRPEQEWKGCRVNEKLPAGVGAAEGTMFITWRETLSYMTRIGVKKGSRVLVVGSGANGLSMAAHAANLGAAIVVLVGSGKRAAEARQAGCATVVDYKDAEAKAKALAASPAGFDIAVDVIGTPSSSALALSCTAGGGTLGIYGRDDIGAIRLAPDSALGSFSVYRGGHDEAEAHERVCAFVKEGKLKASLWLDLAHPFRLEDIGQAFEAVAQRTQLKPLVRIKG